MQARKSVSSVASAANNGDDRDIILVAGNADKISGDVKGKVEKAIADVKEALKGSDSAAIKAAKAVNYEGAGTIEFIADASQGLRADRVREGGPLPGGFGPQGAMADEIGLVQGPPAAGDEIHPITADMDDPRDGGYPGRADYEEHVVPRWAQGRLGWRGGGQGGSFCAEREDVDALVLVEGVGRRGQSHDRDLRDVGSRDVDGEGLSVDDLGGCCRDLRARALEQVGRGGRFARRGGCRGDRSARSRP